MSNEMRWLSKLFLCICMGLLTYTLSMVFLTYRSTEKHPTTTVSSTVEVFEPAANAEVPTTSAGFAVTEHAETDDPAAIEADPELKAARRAPFDPSGDYHPAYAIKEENERFLQFAFESYRKRGKLLLSGWLSVNATEHYRLVSISATPQRLTFRTRKIKGAEYRFEGHFRSGGNLRLQYNLQGTEMLEGKLQKYINDKVVFEIDMPFIYYPGC